MQAVDSAVSSVSFDCYELLLRDGLLPSSNLSDHITSYPRFVFSQTGSIICTFSTNQLHCQFPNGKVFSWTTSEAGLLVSNLRNCPPDASHLWIIADVTFLHNSSRILLLLAPPENIKALRSIICLVDLSDGTSVSFLRFISIRGRAKCIHIVSTDRRALPAFQGAVVVALERGQIALLDFCLDWKIPEGNYLESSSCISVGQFCEAISANELVSPLTPKMEHSLVNLNASRISLNKFYYQTSRDETVEKFPSVSVNVTLLYYVSQIKALVVGFSFGGWQLWSLTKLKILYTFRDLPPVPVPVVCCTFSEPSDDPRYYCYLWIGWQSVRNPNSDFSSVSTSVKSTVKAPKVGLFQLGFRGRIEHIQPVTEDTLYEYEVSIPYREFNLSFKKITSFASFSNNLRDFYGATRRLSTVLSPITTSIGHDTSHWRSHGALLTSIQSLGTNYAANFGLRSNRLTALVWRAAPRIVRIGLFDLDRWYHAQMPAGIRADNSFFAVYDAFLDQSRALPLTAHILPHTIYAYWATIYRRELSAFKICGAVSAVQTPLRGYQDLRKPLPECQLRPSAHGFKALVPFLTGYSVAFATQKFVSRQELALSEISAAIAEASDSTFDATEWVTEAAACGLLQEFEDTDIEILHTLKDAEGSEWITRLALGVENPPSTLLKQIELMDHEEEDFEGVEIVNRTSPQRDLSHRMPSDLEDIERVVKKPRWNNEAQPTRGPKYLPPVWVIIVNCLFEHGMYDEVKKLDGLISSLGWQDFNPRVFIRRWLWLKWLGKKYSLENLLTPIFDVTGVKKTKMDLKGVIKDLCLNFSSLRIMADIAKVVMSPCFSHGEDVRVTDSASISAGAKLKLIQALAEYTRPVSLLIRLGLLPQVSNQSDSTSTLALSALLPYNYAEVDDLIAKLQAVHKAPAFLPPFITGCLLDHLRGISTTSDQTESASISVITSSYPPRHLQSICALWQLFDVNVLSHLPAHLALLTFILFDIVTVNALHEEENDDLIERNQQIYLIGRLRLVEADKNGTRLVTPAPPRLGPVARAVQLQQYVVNQIVSEFPDFEKFISTVRTLWLVDRFRFAEVLYSRLSPLATGQVTDLGHLPEVFPNQALLVAKHCILYGQAELAARFDPRSTSSQTASCIVSSLYQARQLYSRQANRQEASKVLIEAANAFERRGQFLDFIRPGLSHWEAAVLFSNLRSRGLDRLLLASFIARAQYKEAQDALAEIDSSGGRKLSTDPIVRSLISTMSFCLPQLKFLCAFSNLTPGLRENSLHSYLPAGSVVNSASARVFHVEGDEDYTGNPLAKQFTTPKGNRLSIQPSTEDKRRAMEFWDDFDLTQRVLRGEKPFETPRSPVIPNITDSARKLSRKLKMMLYSSSVMSPFPQSHKKTLGTFPSLRESTASTPVNVSNHSRNDFGSVSGENRLRPNLSITVTTSSSSVLPTTSILKVRSTPMSPPKEVLKEISSELPTPTHNFKKEQRKKAFTITFEKRQIVDNGVDLDVASTPLESSTSKDSLVVESSSDDAEITVNESTLLLSHKVSLSGDPLVDENGSQMTTGYTLSTERYTFSPPIRTINPASLPPRGMDDVADALCSARYFDFTSPASYLAKKFITPVSNATPVHSITEESEDFNFSTVADTAAFTFDNETEDEVETFEDETDIEVPMTTTGDESSTLSGTEEVVEIQTPRRSRRKIKKPERYQY